MKVICKLCAALAVVIAAGCSGTSVREHPQLEQQLQDIDSVVVLPPKVRIQSISFTGERERLRDREAVMRAELVEQAREALAGKSYGIVDYDFSEENTANSDLPFALIQIYRGYANAEKQLYKKRKLPEKKKRSIRANLGLSANTINVAVGADAVFLMQYAGYEKSAGTAVKDMAAGMLLGLLFAGGAEPAPSSTESSLDMALVDSISGEVLWSNVGRGDRVAAMMASLPEDIDPPEPFREEARDAGDQPATAPEDR